MAKPTNIIELRNVLLESLQQVREDPRRLAQAGEIANHAGKIISATKLRLEQHMIAGETLEDDFLGKTSGKPLQNKIKLLKGN